MQSKVPKLVLLPGMDGTGRLFDPLIKAMAGAMPHQMVSYPPTIPMGYADLVEFADAALPANEPLVLLGESFSGPIAITLAARHPARVKGLVLCCTFARNPLPWLSPLRGLAAWAPIKQMPMHLSSVALLGRHATPALQEALAQALAPVSAAVLRARIKAAFTVDVTAELARVTAPLQYLRASEDRVIPRQAGAVIQRIQPAMRIVEMAAPHCLLQAVPEEAAQVVLEFMRSQGRIP